MLRQERGIQKSHARKNVLPRDFSMVGFHVLVLHNDLKIRSCMFNKTDLYNFSFDSFSMNLQ